LRRAALIAYFSISTLAVQQRQNVDIHKSNNLFGHLEKAKKIRTKFMPGIFITELKEVKTQD
jgi:hypothetical protein